MRIYKYKIKDTYNLIKMPQDAKILSCSQQNEEIYIWALVDPDKASEEQIVEVFPTGLTELDDEPRIFIGTVLMTNGLVQHVFIQPTTAQILNNLCSSSFSTFGIL